VAIMGSIGTAVYRGDLDNTLAAGLPADAEDAARDTLGGAVAAAGQLPEPAAAGFLDAAREAFAHGLQVTAGISALVAAVAATLVIVVLRRVGVDAAAHTQAQGAAEDTGTPHATDRLATINSAATLPCRCCGPELITTGVSRTGTQEPT
jgi:MFS transporter, DHA2 family, multidrug resistance protein